MKPQVTKEDFIEAYLFAEEPRKLQVVINPVEADSVPQTASVDEIKKITGSLSLTSPSSMVSNTVFCEMWCRYRHFLDNFCAFSF